jgi:hypothetical protein
VSPEPRGSPTRRRDDLLIAGAVVVVVACGVAPAVLGAAAGSLIGGWLGIAVACLLALGALAVLRRRGGDC